MSEIITDNRFEVIGKAKEHLLEATNIETSPDEMAVLDSFLFRCWQMGWLKQYDAAPVRQGMWVDVDRMQMHDLHGVLTWGNSFMCTECNFKTFAVEGHMSQYHYCPCCGAKMDEEEDDA